MRFSGYLHKKIKEAGLSQASFARMAKITPAFVSQIISGNSLPPLDRLSGWSEILGLSLAERRRLFRLGLESVSPGVVPDILSYYETCTFGDFFTHCLDRYESRHRGSRPCEILGISDDQCRSLRTGNATPDPAQGDRWARLLELDANDRAIFSFLATHPFPDSRGREDDKDSLQITDLKRKLLEAQNEIAALRAQLAALGAPVLQTGHPADLPPAVAALQRQMRRAHTAHAPDPAPSPPQHAGAGPATGA